jgi:hypothetical protein
MQRQRGPVRSPQRYTARTVRSAQCIVTRLCEPLAEDHLLGFGCWRQQLPPQAGWWARTDEDGAQRWDAAHRGLVAQLLPLTRDDGDGGGGGGGV